MVIREMDFTVVTYFCAFGLLMYAAVYDFLHHEIPDSLSVALVLLWVVDFAWGGFVLRAALFDLGVGMGVLALGFGLFLLGGMGGGDGKLMASFSLWLGSSHVPLFLAVTFVVGGILALLVLLCGVVREGLKKVMAQKGKKRFAYAPAIAVGGIFGMMHRWASGVVS